MGFFEKLKNGLFKTKNAIVGKIDALFKSLRTVDEDLFDELEELLIVRDFAFQLFDLRSKQIIADLTPLKNDSMTILKTNTITAQVSINI